MIPLLPLLLLFMISSSHQNKHHKLIENTNLQLLHYKQDYQNLHDSHLDQEATSSMHASEMDFQKCP